MAGGVKGNLYRLSLTCLDNSDRLIAWEHGMRGSDCWLWLNSRVGGLAKSMQPCVICWQTATIRTWYALFCIQASFWAARFTGDQQSAILHPRGPTPSNAPSLSIVWTGMESIAQESNDLQLQSPLCEILLKVSIQSECAGHCCMPGHRDALNGRQIVY